MERQAQLDLEMALRNQGLFADYFLTEKLPDLPEWHGVDDSFLKTRLAEATALFNKHAVRFSDMTNEAVTEDDFVKPMLDLLWSDHGPCYQVQQIVSFPGSKRKPDYAFFSSAGGRTNADLLAGKPEYWNSAVALGDAKKWSAPLDRMRREENPSGQITDYLYRSKVRWGILTNGRQWRLYEREASAGGGVYFEVDLLRIIQEQDLAGFR